MESAQRKVEEHYVDAPLSSTTPTLLHGQTLYSEVIDLSLLSGQPDLLASKLLKLLHAVLTPNTNSFFSHFAAENSIRSSIHSVLAWCKDRNRNSGEVDQILSRAMIIAEWYQQREITVHQWSLREEEFCENGVQILSLAVTKDVERHGLQGVLLSPRIALAVPSSVFFKVSLNYRGRQLNLAPGWESWRDSLSGLSLIKERLKWALCVPLEGHGESSLRPRFIDSLELFIPYQSVEMNLEENSFTGEITYSCGIYTRSGTELTALSRRDYFRRAPVKAQYKLPSCQQSSLSPFCALTGTSLGEISVMHSKNGEIDCTVSITLRDLHDVSHIEVRVLNENGDLIAGDKNYSDLGGAFYLEYDLSTIIDSGGQGEAKIFIPLEVLELDEGFHRLQLELVIVGLENRILCGEIEPFNIFVK